MSSQKIKNYTPSVLGAGSLAANASTVMSYGHFFWDDNYTLLTPYAVECMRTDYQIEFGLSVLCAPIATATWEVSAEADEVKAYVDATVKRFWQHDLPRLLPNYFAYGTVMGEVVWAEEDEQTRFDSIFDVHISDANALVKGGKIVGLKVRNVECKGKSEIKLWKPDVFWLARKARFGQWYGKTCLASAWLPWEEKRDRKGAIASRRKWFVKNAYEGGTMYHPIGDLQLDGRKVACADYAQEIVEKKESGGVMALPSVKDGQGNRLWEYEAPKENGNLQGVREYVTDLDMEILKGMGIPPEVIQAGETGSGYAGRWLPARGFFASLDADVDLIIRAIDEFIVAPGVKMNFGPGVNYKIEPVSLVPPEDDQQGGMGGGVGMDMGGMDDMEGGEEEPVDDLLGELLGEGEAQLSLSDTVWLAQWPDGFTGIYKYPSGRRQAVKDGRRAKMSDLSPDERGNESSGKKAARTKKVKLDPKDTAESVREMAKSGGNLENVVNAILKHTTKEIATIKKELQVKASGNKAELARKVAERAMEKFKAPEQPEQPESVPGTKPYKVVKGDDKRGVETTWVDTNDVPEGFTLPKADAIWDAISKANEQHKKTKAFRYGIPQTMKSVFEAARTADPDLTLPQFHAQVVEWSRQGRVLAQTNVDWSQISDEEAAHSPIWKDSTTDVSSKNGMKSWLTFKDPSDWRTPPAEQPEQPQTPEVEQPPEQPDTPQPPADEAQPEEPEAQEPLPVEEFGQAIAEGGGALTPESQEWLDDYEAEQNQFPWESIDKTKRRLNPSIDDPEFIEENRWPWESPEEAAERLRGEMGEDEDPWSVFDDMYDATKDENSEYNRQKGRENPPIQDDAGDNGDESPNQQEAQQPPMPSQSAKENSLFKKKINVSGLKDGQVNPSQWMSKKPVGVGWYPSRDLKNQMREYGVDSIQSPQTESQADFYCNVMAITMADQLLEKRSYLDRWKDEVASKVVDFFGLSDVPELSRYEALRASFYTAKKGRLIQDLIADDNDTLNKLAGLKKAKRPKVTDLMSKSSDVFSKLMKAKPGTEKRASLQAEYDQIMKQLSDATNMDVGEKDRESILELFGESTPPIAYSADEFASQQQAEISNGVEFVSKLISPDIAKNIPPVKFSVSQTGRAFYHPSEKTINLFRTSVHGAKTVVHELGHHLEQTIPGLHDAAMAFLNYRCGNEQARKMDDKVKGFYDNHEHGRDDDFAKAFPDNSHYVGKIYNEKGASEVISMGLEKLYTDPIGFAKADPEFFVFLVGAIKGKYNA